MLIQWSEYNFHIQMCPALCKTNFLQGRYVQVCANMVKLSFSLPQTVKWRYSIA